MIKTLKGNLITLAEGGMFDMIAHGCNCKHTMGAGIARQLAKKYPEILFADKRKNWSLGDVDFVRVSSGFYVANCYTQIYPGKSGDYYDTVNQRLSAIHTCFSKISAAYTGKSLRLGIPLIGSGLAGLNWLDIYDKITSAICNSDINLTVVEYYQ